MFLTTKIPWKHLAALLTLTCAFALCLLAGQKESQQTSATLPSEEELTAGFLQSLGWELEGQRSTDRIELPEVFGEEYADFLALQEEGGFSLAEQAGKTVTRYSYLLKNYPTGEEGIWADLLVLDGAIVGGEVRSADLDGFMAPLLSPEALMER